RFLAQATFGVTSVDIARLRAVGYEAWLDEQFAAPVSTQVPYLNWVSQLPDEPDNHVNYHAPKQSWWINAVGSPDPSRGNVRPTDQLRQRVAFALSEIFVISTSNGTLIYQPWGLASYYDLLSTDAFGNYRALLEDVTLHPSMGIFLSMIGNQKPDPSRNIRPDENYAREVMQLFSVGLHQLNIDGSRKLSGGQPIPTYDQNVVRGMASVLTGWNWNNIGCGAASYTCCDSNTYTNCGPYEYQDPRWLHPMQPVQSFHDSQSNKQLLNYPGVALPGGMLSAGGDAQSDLAAALDNIFLHPNVGPFIARRLIQRLVTSNPSPPYIERVSRVFNDDGSSAHLRGNLQAVVKAILLDPEARYGHLQAPDTFGKLREPLLKLSHYWRAMDATSINGRIKSTYPDWMERYGQAALRSPSVFNFFRPDFRQQGEITALGMTSPEFQILTASLATDTPDDLFMQVFCYFTGSDACWFAGHVDTMAANLDRDAALAESNPAQLLDTYNLLFMSGQMSPHMRQVILDQMATVQNRPPNFTRGRARAMHALYLILNSPEYSIQK
ncbi:MAG: DUF1800 domain-containing protein, partial [Dokdonella sp.]